MCEFKSFDAFFDKQKTKIYMYDKDKYDEYLTNKKNSGLEKEKLDSNQYDKCSKDDKDALKSQLSSVYAINPRLLKGIFRELEKKQKKYFAVSSSKVTGKVETYGNALYRFNDSETNIAVPTKRVEFPNGQKGILIESIKEDQKSKAYHEHLHMFHALSNNEQYFSDMQTQELPAKDDIKNLSEKEQKRIERLYTFNKEEYKTTTEENELRERKRLYLSHKSAPYIEDEKILKPFAKKMGISNEYIDSLPEDLWNNVSHSFSQNTKAMKHNSSSIFSKYIKPICNEDTKTSTSLKNNIIPPCVPAKKRTHSDDLNSCIKKKVLTFKG